MRSDLLPLQRGETERSQVDAQSAGIQGHAKCDRRSRVFRYEGQTQDRRLGYDILWNSRAEDERRLAVLVLQPADHGLICQDLYLLTWMLQRREARTLHEHFQVLSSAV